MRLSTTRAGMVLATLSCSAAYGLNVEYPEGSYSFSSDERERILAIASETEQEVRNLLPELPNDLVLEVRAGQAVIPETGDLGAALTPDRISWTVDASREGGVLPIAERYLRETLFHEMHHLAHGWTMANAFGKTILDAAVSEGIATAFARDFAHAATPWADYPDEVEAWVDELIALPADARYDHWMFQHPDGRRWIGYRAGTYIADQAMIKSGKSAADLASLTTSDILDLARPDN